MDPQESPGEIKSREVELDPQESPEEIKSREVVRVGVTVYRYVSLCNARLWLIHTLKNNRGRGWRSDWGQEDVVTLTGQPEVSDTPDPSSRPETNGGAQSDSGTAAVQILAPLNVTHRPAASTSEREKGDNENSRAIQPGDPSSVLPCSEDAVASSSTTGIATGQGNDEGVFPSDETAKPAGATQRQHGGKDGVTQRQAGHEDSGPPSTSTGTPSDAALGSSSSSPQRRAGHEDSSAPSGALLGSSSSPPGGAAPPGGAEGEAGASSQSSQPGPDADADTQDLSRRSNSPARPKRSRRVAAKKWNTAGDFDQVEVQANSTYEKIRLRSRMWRRPEGGLNAKVLSGYLNSIQFHLMRHPGVSLRALTHHYRSLFTPVDLRDLLEILEQLGCVRLMVMKAAAKASLFSPQSSVHITQGLDVLGASDEQLIIEPAVDCCHRLGQFLTYIK